MRGTVITIIEQMNEHIDSRLLPPCRIILMEFLISVDTVLYIVTTGSAMKDVFNILPNHLFYELFSVHALHSRVNKAGQWPLFLC